MDVRCEKCKTEYAFDDARVDENGVTVRCVECNHIFTVKRGASDQSGSGYGSGDSAQQRPWLLKKESGEIFTFESLATLHSWIVERRAFRTDEISRSGRNWKKLGDIAELSTFFHVLDQADQAKVDDSLSGTTRPLTSLGRDGVAYAEGVSTGQFNEPKEISSGGRDPGSSWSNPSTKIDDDIGGIEDEDFTEYRRGGPGKWIAMVALVGMVAGAVYFFMFWGERDVFSISDLALDDAGTQELKTVFGDESDSEKDEAVGVLTKVQPAVEKEENRKYEATQDDDIIEEPAPSKSSAHKVVKAPAPVERTTVKATGADSAPSFQSIIRQALNARNRGQIDRALELYTSAIEMMPERVEGYSGQGFCYIEKRDWVRAISAFEQALQRSSRHGDSIIGLAEAHRSRGNGREARRLYERYLSLYPNGPEAAVARTNLDRL